MKLGIVGTGKIVQEVLPVLMNISGLECCAICGTIRSTEKLESLCEKYRIPNSYTNYEVFLEDKKIETVYIAVPNKLHYEMAMQALKHNKNVIVEKPMTCALAQTEELIMLAREKRLFLFEAITTQYQKNYEKIKELLPQLGKIKIVQCNFSQYSSRYDDFLQKKVAPVFDPKQNGGALLDINLYNIHYVTGLFGAPLEVIYRDNKELPGGDSVEKTVAKRTAAKMAEHEDSQAIDVSGVVTMVYPEFIAVCIAAKDCGAPTEVRIQGTKGYLMQDTPPNICGEVTMVLNDGKCQQFSEDTDKHRMVSEFVAFERIVRQGSLDECYEMLEKSRIVSSVLNQCK